MKMYLNGWDVSDLFDPLNVDFSSEKVEGSNSGTSMAGSKIIDLVAVKAVVSIKFGLMTPEQYRELRALGNMDYITAVYDDPDTGETATRVMIPTAGTAREVPLLGGGYMYKNLSFTLRER